MSRLHDILSSGFYGINFSVISLCLFQTLLVTESGHLRKHVDFVINEEYRKRTVNNWIVFMQRAENKINKEDI